MGNPEISIVILPPDMLEHAERGDAVELSLDFAIVLQPDLHRQAPAALDREVALFRADGDADHRDALVFGGASGKSAPAAGAVDLAVDRGEGEHSAGDF